MCIDFVCVRFVKNVGYHYNQSGLLKIEIVILLRVARFQYSGTPPSSSDGVNIIFFKISIKSFVYKIPYRRAPRLVEYVTRAKVSCIQLLLDLVSSPFD